MKHLFTAAAMLFSMTAFAQVGINNTSPKATLDITAKTTDGSKPEGLIIPQLSGSNIHTATAAGVYGSNQKGLIVYASSADTNPTGATANITAAGYYYFDGTNWQKISTGNTVSTSLASGNILVGSASNVATAVSPTGDVTISNTGATSIGAGKVTTTHLANNAVTVAKLPAGATTTTFLRGDGTWVTPTDTNTTYTAGTGLTLTGTSFSANDATTGTKGIVQLSGDLTGTAASPTVAKIQNKAVSSTAPTNGQVLKYNTTTSAWEPAADTDTNTTYTAGNGLTLTGTSFSANDATTGTKGIVQLSGDLTGTAASPTVAKIQNKAVSSTAPTNGQVLKYNTTTSAWEPAADTDTNTTYTGSASINLNGTSFERTALSGDVTASANSNTTTIAANAVTSAKIADGTIANGDLDAGVGGIYKGNGALSGNTTVAQGGSTLAFTSTATNGFSVDGTTLSVDAANHRLGIGTTSPSSKLDVNGGLKIGNDASTCSAANQGTLKYVGGQCYLCNGASWSPFAIASPQVAVVKSTTGFPSAAVMGGNMNILSQQVPISTAGFAANSISATLGNDGVRDFIKLPAAGVYQINFSTFGSCYNFSSISEGTNGTGLNVSIYKAPNNNTYTLLESYRSSAFTPYAIVAQSNYNTQLNASFVVSVSSNDKLAFQLDFIKIAAAGNTCTCGGVQTLPTGGTFTSQIIVNKL